MAGDQTTRELRLESALRKLRSNVASFHGATISGGTWAAPWRADQTVALRLIDEVLQDGQ